MSSNTPPLATSTGDFAVGERTEAETPEEVREERLEGDFAAGERTMPLTPDELSEESLHGDFAGGERTEPLTPEEEIPGTFADTDV
jgi:hypothetical protein